LKALVSALNDFIYECNTRAFSPKSIKNYHNTPYAFLKWVHDSHGVEVVEDITKRHIQEYFDFKLKSGLSRTYVITIHKILRQFFIYLQSEEITEKNPIEKIKYIQADSKVIEVYSDAMAMKIINFYNEKDYLSVRNNLIIKLQIDTGIRCTETIKIMLDNVQPDDNRIFLTASKGNKERFVYLSIQIKREIRRYLKLRASYFMGKSVPNNFFLSRTGRPLTVEGIEWVYKRVAEHYNITNVRVSPHTSRHYFAIKSLEYNDIYTVSKLLGHGSIVITQRYLQALSNKKIIEKNTFINPMSKMK
jgi:integrase/recombinase XerD